MRNKLLLVSPILVAILLYLPAWASTTAQTTSKPAQRTAQKATRVSTASQSAVTVGEELSAQVMAVDDVPVPAQESGPVAKVLVKVGDTVTENQVLVEMDSAAAKLEVEAASAAFDAAMAKAEDPSEVEYANASLDLAIAELDAMMGIRQTKAGAVKESEIRKLKFAQTKATKGVEAAQTAQQIAKKSALVEKAKVSMAEQKLKRLQIPSPLNAVVSDVFAQKGAWINAGDPVAQVTRMDLLRVDFRLDAKKYNPSDLVDRKLVVTLELAGGEKVEFPGKIAVVSPIVQRSFYMAKCEIENRQEKGQWLLRPGLSVEARMQ
jgi:multidrug efflux pump subunit AcrA (membrane-fusion protein)